MAQLELKNGGEFNLLQCDLILSDGTLSNIPITDSNYREYTEFNKCYNSSLSDSVLRQKYIEPPFSVLDTKLKFWKLSE